jgi:hypothetical protein
MRYSSPLQPKHWIDFEQRNPFGIDPDRDKWNRIDHALHMSAPP